MAADEQIRVSGWGNRETERRRPGKGYSDVRERLRDEDDTGGFDDGFGRWSDAAADRGGAGRQPPKDKRKRRVYERSEDAV